VAHEQQTLTATRDGVLSRLDAMAVGVAAWRLGAGRTRKEHPVQAGAGVVMHAKPGDAVRAGQALLTLHTDEPDRFERALAALDGGVVVSDTAPAPQALVVDRVVP
jgi:thymidine phosphorylase